MDFMADYKESTYFTTQHGSKVVVQILALYVVASQICFRPNTLVSIIDDSKKSQDDEESKGLLPWRAGEKVDLKHGPELRLGIYDNGAFLRIPEQ